MKNTFDRHDFAFIWSYGESMGRVTFSASVTTRSLTPMVGIKLINGSTSDCRFINGDASHLSTVPDELWM